MDITSLKYFITAAQTQHMTAAAQHLNITQPSLSTSIQRLESELGFRLFDRVGRKIVLNEYGKIFLNGALSITDTMNSTIAEMEACRKDSVSFIKIACSSSPTNMHLIDMLLSRGICLEVTTIPENWDHELLSGNCDLIITTGVSNLRNIERKVLHIRNAVLAAGKNHPLANAKNISIQDVLRYPFCSTSAPHSLSAIAHQQLRASGFTPRITYLCRNSSDMVSALSSGKYLGMMGSHNLIGNEHIVKIDVPEFSLTLPIYLYWRKIDTNNSSLNVVRQSILEYFSVFDLNTKG